MSDTRVLILSHHYFVPCGTHATDNSISYFQKGSQAKKMLKILKLILRISDICSHNLGGAVSGRYVQAGILKWKKKTRRQIDCRTIYHIVSAAVLVGSLLFSVFFYFRAVFFRTIQAFKDFGLSVAYYFTELSGFEGLITPRRSGEIPNNATEVLPFQPSEFITGLKAYGKAPDFKENAEAFFSGTVEGAFRRSPKRRS